MIASRDSILATTLAFSPTKRLASVLSEPSSEPSIIISPWP